MAHSGLVFGSTRPAGFATALSRHRVDARRIDLRQSDAMKRLSGTGRAPAPVMHNLFFALWPDADVRARIDAAARRVKEDHAPRGRWIKPHRHHLTLHYLGEHADLPEELVATACAAGDRVRASAFDFALDIAGSFANRRIPWWIGCSETAPELSALWDGISAGLRTHGHPIPDGTDLVAHVTILRDADRILPPTPIAPIKWPVGEFVLIDSLLGPGAGYTILRRWPLRP
jgi:2'-5' RNA ligase